MILKHKKTFKALFSFLFIIFIFHIFFTVHLSSNIFSNNSINYELSDSISDDHREAYRWLYMNTNQNDIIWSFWDIGYQLWSIANKTTLIDGNTNNISHINNVSFLAVVNEEKAFEIAKEYDVDYCVISFGGASGFVLDDINRFQSVLESMDNINVSEYINENYPFIVGPGMKQKMKKSTLFKFSYYRFGEFENMKTKQKGFDVVRNVTFTTDFSLWYFNEVYTAKNWIYNVKNNSLWNE